MSDRLTILQGDCIEEMRKLPAESVHLIVTSPPYWGLRDYKIPPSVWGGDPECVHDFNSSIPRLKRGANRRTNLESQGKHCAAHSNFSAIDDCASDFCQCGAWRGVFGLEPTADLYIEHAVLIFREARRVLRSDGTLWVNLGDIYSNESKWGGKSGGKNSTSCAGGYQGQRVKRGNRPAVNGHGKLQVSGAEDYEGPNRDSARKAGDLVGIPWRVALALQADGWCLRRDNIWFKPNPMPESVNGWRWEKHRVKVGSRKANGKKPSGWDTAADTTHHDSVGRFGDDQVEAVMQDCPGCSKCETNGGLILRRGNWRCTTSHEYVFQFSKSASYFCDAEAARERATGSHGRGAGVGPKAVRRNSRFNVDKDPAHQTPGRMLAKQNRSFSAAVKSLTGNRNMRSVWKIATKAYRGAHFATFPPELVRPIIKAASPVKCCASCGAPFAPVVERGEADRAQQRACGGDSNGNYDGKATKDFALNGAQDASAVKARILAGMVSKTVTGYRATCECRGVFPVSCTQAVVLDLFGGSGTVGQVSLELGRSAILIEISKEYIPLIERRCHVTSPLEL